MQWNQFAGKAEEVLRRLVKPSGEDLPSGGEVHVLHQRMQQKGYWEKKIHQQESYDYRKAYRLLHVGLRRRWIRISGAAAAIILLIGMGAVYYLQFTGTSHPVQNDLVRDAVVPGFRQAYLRTASGESIYLDAARDVVLEEPGVQVRTDSTGLYYELKQDQADTLGGENILTVPRGGEYFLTLSDGTKVWVNADSELKYPLRFSGESREVYIRGEAYFEVTAQDDSQPFIVHTDRGSVTVLGTSFCVRSYRDSDKWITTLVEGRVKCTWHKTGADYILLPNQQLVACNTEAPALQEVDPRLWAGWREGRLAFEEERLDEIMEQLSRWYDVYVFYANDSLKSLHFTGELNRFKSIDTFIEIFERSAGITIERKENVLVIK